MGQHSPLRIKQPDLTSASRGVLCPSLTTDTNEPYLCWYGSCNTDTTNAAKCNCESGYEGPQCHQQIRPPVIPAPEEQSTWVYPAIGCVLLSAVVLACWHRDRIEKR